MCTTTFQDEILMCTTTFQDEILMCTTSFQDEILMCTTTFQDEILMCTTTFQDEVLMCTTTFHISTDCCPSGQGKDEMSGEWRRQHNKQLYEPYSSPNIIQVIKSRMGKIGHMACMENRMGAYRVLVGRPEGKRLLGRLLKRIFKM